MGNLILLIISLILCFVLFIYLIKTKNKKQIHISVILVTLLQIIHCLSLIAQILLKDTNIDPITFEYFAYISGCFMPVTVFFIGLIFSRTKIEFKKTYLLLFIIPIISLLLLWTNNLHHWFYISYSTNTNDAIVGKYFMIHSIYSYILLFIGLVYLIRYSIKNSGFFSKQSILIIVGSLIPILLNILGTFNIIPMTIYITPISFTFTILFYAIAIFKFNFLSIAPIALQRVVDRMSDSYLVINEENKIIDFNDTFLKNVHSKPEDIRNRNIFELISTGKNLSINENILKNALESSKQTSKTVSFEKYIPALRKYFNIEISSITNKNTFLGTLILFKDITQHINDMNTIQNKQDQLIEQERLASLGQMIGGIAHNLKTPIMSIAGAAEGIKDLVNEFDASIGNPVVNDEDFHDIAKDMYTWVDKIKDYTEYMSDVITAVKGQAVVLGNDNEINFTINELLKRVNILMKHELKNAVIYLNTSVKIDENTIINGDVNSLVQVINNMISNAIQAYGGKQEQNIDLIVDRYDEKHIAISIKDYGPGLPDTVKAKLFKEMVTTKGKNGTGLGLYMSYSNIKARFNGDIKVDSKKGKGTTFNIILPL